MDPHARDTAAQFSRQAEAYADSRSHARGADLEILLDFARPLPGERCLDLATGPGHTAQRVAATAGLVVGFDIAPGMIAVARRRAAAAGAENLRFLVGDVHSLPFPDGSLDLVTCRIAPHHFADLPAALAEAARVLGPKGRLVVEDSLAPGEAPLAAFLEALEKRRDPTHVHSLDRAEWFAACASAGLQIVRDRVHHKRHDFDPRTRADRPGAARDRGNHRRRPGGPRPHPRSPVRDRGRPRAHPQGPQAHLSGTGVLVLSSGIENPAG